MNRSLSVWTLAALFAAAVAQPASAQIGGIAAWAFPRQVTIAQLEAIDPSTSPGGGATSWGMRLVLDDSDCDSGTVDAGPALCCDLGATWGLCPASGSGGGVTDHGALTGLGDDDHALYALDTDLSTHEGNASAHHAKTTAASEITSGVLTHERGGLEADVSLYAGLVAISGGLTSNVTDLAGLNTALGSGLVTGAHFTPSADPGVDHSAYVAGHGDGTDCDPGEYARGSDGSGNATGCTPDDAGTDDQTGSEVPLTDTGAFFTTDNVEAALQQVGPTMTDARTPTAHAASHGVAGGDAVTITEAQISDLSHTAAFVPNTDPGVDHASYVAGHGNGANCTAGFYPLGVDAAGAVESCTSDADTFGAYTPTGSDLQVVTGTAGGSGICAEWNLDGDLVAAASAAACGTGGASSSGTGLQYGNGAGGFSEVTGSSVSGSAVTLAGDIVITKLAATVKLEHTPTEYGHLGAGSTFAFFQYGEAFTVRQGTSGFGGLVMETDETVHLGTGLSSVTGAGATLTVDNAVTINNTLKMVPSATPPVTCNAGNLGQSYADTSGGDCYCNGVSWANRGAVGDCS